MSFLQIRTQMRFAVATAVLSVGSLSAFAAQVSLKADLAGSHEVPAKDVAGTGTLTATLDTDTGELKYRVSFKGLTGPVTAAHFHGPAGEGVNAKPQVPVNANPIESPLEGTATLSQEQTKDLLDGKWYFNLHTAANPGGEIRGQVVKE
ncbi:CHRD domain-containing protein [Terriglobus albidus]|uniref:CHRD domain-containing protein n=1 Tax=Terriglobus albidus TaxID=1592106 RepID=UPI0021E06427|nr:CHRD domain-containing protein [Terriglobus albidus]